MTVEHIPREMVIVGAGGHAKEVLWYWERMAARGSHVLPNLIGLIATESTSLWADWQVLGDDAWAWKNLPVGSGFHVAIGDPQLRQRVVAKYLARKWTPVTLVDPSVEMGPGCRIGSGSMICLGCILTVDIDVGSFCLINRRVTIGHDSVIEEGVTVHPHATISGQCHIGAGSEIGSGAILLPGVTIPAGTRIGAGAVVTRSLSEPGTYVGAPARRIK